MLNIAKMSSNTNAIQDSSSSKQCSHTSSAPKQNTNATNQMQIDLQMRDLNQNESGTSSNALTADQNMNSSGLHDATIKMNGEHFKYLTEIKALTFSIESTFVSEAEISRIQKIKPQMTKTNALHLLLQKQIANILDFKQNAPQRYTIFQDFDEKTHTQRTFIRLIFLENTKCLKVYKQLMDLNKMHVKQHDSNGYYENKQSFIITNVELAPEEVIYKEVVGHLSKSLPSVIFKRKYESNWITLSNQIVYTATEEQNRKIINLLKDEALITKLPLNQKPMEVKKFRPPTISHCSKCGRTGHNKSSCDQNDKVCNICLEPGHLAANCEMKLQQTRITARTCVICNEHGHWAQSCEKTRWSTQPMHQTWSKNQLHSSGSNSRTTINTLSSASFGTNQPLSPILRQQGGRSWAKTVSFAPSSTAASTHVSSKSQQDIIDELQRENKSIREDLTKLQQQMNETRDEVKQTAQQVTQSRDQMARDFQKSTQEIKDQQEAHYQSLVALLKQNNSNPSPPRKVSKKNTRSTRSTASTIPSNQLNSMIQIIDPYDYVEEDDHKQNQQPNNNMTDDS